jgi:hypothetical protein
MTKQATPESAASGPLVASVKLSELNLYQLVQVQQQLGRQMDKLREDRAHIKRLIDARIAAGERESVILRAEEEPQSSQPEEPSDAGAAQAPGVVIEASAKA